MIDFFQSVSSALGLGAVLAPPRPLTGGFLHRMYRLSAKRGEYAVKLLNPHIMQRPTAMENFRRAELLESQLESAGLPVLPALRFGKTKMQQLGEQYFYIFDWFDGSSLPGSEIRAGHCREIGAALAGIHAVDRRTEAFETAPLHIDWTFFAERLPERDESLGSLLFAHLDMLNEAQRRANEARLRLPGVTAICHNDLDSKNVLWNASGCRIIDLECLSRSNPFLEMYSTALYWSGIEECEIDPQRFAAFVDAYAQAGGALPPDWSVIHDADTGRLEWLEYNLQRALGIHCSADEIPVGMSEVRKTLAQLDCCARLRTTLK